MIRPNTIQPTFVGGELSPRLLGRVDMERFLVAGQRVENFAIRHQGPLIRRLGSQWLETETCAGARIINFAYSREDSEIIRFGCGEIIVGTA